MKLKKELVEILKSKGWNGLAGRLLMEDRDFVTNHADAMVEALAIEMQLDELAITKENKEPLENLFV